MVVREAHPSDDTVGYWFKLSNTLANKGQYEEAITALDKALELNPNDSGFRNLEQPGYGVLRPRKIRGCEGLHRKSLEMTRRVQSPGITKELPLSCLAGMLRPDLLLHVQID